MTNPAPWDSASKNLVDISPVLNDAGLVTRFDFFIEVTHNEFTSKLKARLALDGTRTADSFSTEEIAELFLANATTMGKAFNMKYELYLNRL